MRVLFVLLTLFGLAACKQQNQAADTSTHQNISRYLVAAPPANLYVNDPIMIRFKRLLVDGHPDEVQGVKISPSLVGKWTWSDNQTLRFEQDGIMNYNTTYTVTADMNVLLDETGLKPLTLSYATRSPRCTMILEQPEMKLENESIEVAVAGMIKSSDYVKPEDIEKMLSAKSDGKRIEITWDHTNGRDHKYVLYPSLEDRAKKITLSWNGKAIDKKFVGTEDLFLESLDEFSISDVSLGKQGSQHVKILFSQPLDASTNYEGLVRIEDVKKSPRISVDGNAMLIYPQDRLTGAFSISVDPKVASYSKIKLDEPYTFDLTIEPPKPAIRKVGGGMITPSSEGMIYTFEAVNLDTVDLEIFKIYEDNMLQFLQDNSLGDDYGLQQVGKIVHQVQVPLRGLKRIGGADNWKLFQLDLSTLIGDDPNTVYQVVIGYRPSYANYTCDNDPMKGFRLPREGQSIRMYQSNYAGYEYEHRSNPCYPRYYNPDRFISQNVLFSDVAAVVKRGQNGIYNIATMSIRDANPLGGVSVRFYDYQQQLIASTQTSSAGFAEIGEVDKASFIICEHSSGAAFVRVFDGEALSVSDFDTGGKKSKSDIDGFIYTDRGVYRPGDTVHMHFMLEAGDELQLPDKHPVTLKVKNARGKLVSSMVTSDHIDHIYTFKIPTNQNDPTGNWRAEIQVGATSFYKSLSVETVKPNRLRISVDTPDLINYANKNERKINIASQWLHGASANGLRAVVDANWSNYKPSAKVFSEYEFVDPARNFSNGAAVLYDGNLDASGNAKFDLKLDKNPVYPMMVKANLTSRVYEKGGDFSENYSSIKVSPYSHYVGLKVPTNDWGYANFKIGEAATVKSVVTDPSGKIAANRNLTVGIYDINWRWWYYSGEKWRIYELNSAEHKQAIYKTTAKTDANGQVSIVMPTDDFEYGRKMIRICDSASGHCTGDFFYMSGWKSNISEEERNSLTKLNFASDKKKYQVGETVELSIPSEKGSRILVSIEDDQKTILQDWVEGEEGSTIYRFGVNVPMAPNVYAHVMLIQPQASTDNDLPLRMYGVIPINIENAESILHPEITAATKFEPEEEFTVSVTEEDGKDMNYTIAIVDEGLLDLTNYVTPDPHKNFYAKRSLGVKTWDMYDHIAYGKEGSPDGIISVGGDAESGASDDGGKKAIRFKPVVFSAGPFQLKKGERRNHKFTMPNYIGSVRTMIIAKSDEAYGRTEESTPVKTPLMILPTVPRVLSPEEKLVVPSSVFVMEDGIRNVNASIATNDYFKTVSSSDEVTFSEVGEQMAYFDLEVGTSLGIGEINVSAEGGGHKASQQISLDIRNPVPPTTNVINTVIEPNTTWATDYIVPGMVGSNNGIIELSQLPNLNLEDRMGGLVRYPYGCIEQTTSAVFPQLYLADLTDYIAKDKIERNVKAGIKRIARMELGGGFRYWPGDRGGAHSWGTSYAGHFLIEARNKGYFVSQSMMSRWSTFQENKARNWKVDNSSKYRRQDGYIDQAYRLYTLALNSTPSLSAMNLLRMESDMPSTAKFLLAAAYAMSSKPKVALDLVKGADASVDGYNSRGGTFGSDLRDLSLIAQTMTALDRKTEAAELIRKIAEQLNTKNWYSTQTTAQALLAVGKYMEENGSDKITAEVQLGDSRNADVDYDKAIFTYQFDPDKESSNKASINNTSTAPLFVSVQVTGQPAPSTILTEAPSNNNVSISVAYTTLNGKQLDVSSLEQGTDFIAKVSVKNLNTKGSYLEGMALTQIIPSGWEIRSGRLNKSTNLTESGYEYRDVRDDRVHTFFDLRGTQTYALLLNATYEGEFFLPPVSVEAMYDKSVSARSKGSKVRVRKAGS